MEKLPLKIQARSTQESVNAMRARGQVPGIVYGNIKNTPIAVEEQVLKKTYIKAGESTLVELDLDGKSVPVLFHAIDFDPVSDRMIHADFYAVDMSKEVEAEVHIRLTGESPAVKDLGAILVTALHVVTVKALPANLPHELTVDLSKLAEFGATLTVADIQVPTGVTLLSDASEVIVIAQEPREEEVEAPPVAEAAATAEGATPAEGAAAPGAADAGKKKE